MHRFLCSSLSLRRQPSSFSPSLCSSLSTHLSSSTNSESHHSLNSLLNPLDCPQNQSNSIETKNGYSCFQQFNQKPRFSNTQMGFNRFFSSGYLSNRFDSGRRLDGNGIGVGFKRNLSSDTGRDSMEYDVVIVGAGPAGLAAAIRLKQICLEKNVNLSVCVVEKGAEVGAHILSGNVFEPRALNELLPQWKQEEAPISVPVSSDKFWFLTKNRALSLPSPFENKGNYVISLSQLVRWLAGKAEELGVEIYPGFAASEILFDANDKVIGIGTNDMGIAKDGSKKDNFQRGVELKGRVTLLAEGCRGSLSEKIIKNYKLREENNAQHQTYALGIKEVWEIDEGKHKPGTVVHTLGWPLDHKTYGGSFLYHMNDRYQLALWLL